MSSSEKTPPKGAAATSKITHLGEFRLKRKLGAGGMGDVYLAEQEDLGGRHAALKVTPPEPRRAPPQPRRMRRQRSPARPRMREAA